MKVNEYEIEISKFDRYPKESQPVCYALGLAGESGEVCDKLKKIIRDDNGVFMTRDENVLNELGDVLWYITRLGSYFGYSINEIMIANYEKLLSRNVRGKIGGSGDKR